LYAVQGHLQKAYQQYQQAEKFIQKTEGQHQGAMSIVDMGYSEILYEWNDLEAASTHIQKGLEFIPLWSKADDTALAYIVYSQIQQAQGNMSSAEKHIQQGSQTIRSSGVFSEARGAVTAAEVGLQLKQRDILAVHRWSNALEDRLTSGHPFRFENELVLMVLARVYIFQGEFDKGLKLLSQLETSAQEGGREGRLIKILILQALILHTKGDADEAFSSIEKALALAEPEGYVRTFIDEGPPMQRLLTQWASRGEFSHLKVFASQLAAQFDGQAKTTDQGMLIEPLTPREIEVLTLVALGKTNKAISVELVVSPGTVKAHTSSIYRKLDVSNRTEAVARARELDILS